MIARPGSTFLFNKNHEVGEHVHVTSSVIRQMILLQGAYWVYAGHVGLLSCPPLRSRIAFSLKLAMVFLFNSHRLFKALDFIFPPIYLYLL